jgi:hypothetical protein
MVIDLVVSAIDLPTFLTDTTVSTIDRTQLGLVKGMVAEDHLNILLHGRAEIQALWIQLRSLLHVLQRMTYPRTFALIVTSSSKNGSWQSRDVRAEVIKSLPEQCSNIEIDTQGQD